MITIDYTPIFDAVRQAAQLCAQVQHTRIASAQNNPEQDDVRGIARKTGAEPVTIADYGSQALLCRAISRAYPAAAVIAEEGGTAFSTLLSDTDQQAVAGLVGAVLGEAVTTADIVRWLDHGQDRSEGDGFTWVIDPIDGTKGFIAGRHYVIALAVVQRGRVLGGVMGAPTYPTQPGGYIFAAQNGSGYAYPLNGEGTPRTLRASERTAPQDVRVVESVEKSHASRAVMAQVRERAGFGAAQVQLLDSQEKYSMVAAGDADLYLRLPRMHSTRPHMIWDHAPGASLVYAAGGTVTDVDGSPLDFAQGKTLAKNRGMIVSNGKIHDAVVRAAQEVLNL